MKYTYLHACKYLVRIPRTILFASIERDLYIFVASNRIDCHETIRFA